jgi:penicillin-binding protein 2
MTEANSRFRLTVVGVIVFALFSTLFARLWFLQVGDSQSYAAQAARSRIRTIREPAIRGSIVDRDGDVLVQNTLVDTITVERGITDAERKVTVKNLAGVLAVTPASIEAELDSPKYSVYEPVPIGRKASRETVTYILEHPELFPGVKAERQSVREYPVRLENGDPVASHLLGYVASINKQEFKIRKGQGYTPNDLIGKQGIEELFESELKGEPRERRLEVDSRGRLVGQASETLPTPGNDVELTIDRDVQMVAENTLHEAMTSARGYNDADGGGKLKADGGSVIVMNAQTGDVVALASAPTFDISKFTTGIPAEDYQRYTDPANNFPLINRAVQGLYAPGSTFKPFSAYAGLKDKLHGPPPEEKPFDELFTFNDQGFIRFGGGGTVEERQNARRQANGIVDLDRALTVSSDVFFYNIGLMYWQNYGVGREDRTDLNEPQYGMQRAARLFGFGKATGIGLAGEARGRIPDLEFKLGFNVGNPDGGSQVWLPGDSMNLAVGQGDVLVTPMQLAVAYAALANGGTIVTPRLAQEVLKGGSTLGTPESVRELPEQPSHKVTLDPALVDKVIPGLVGAVCSPEGTAYGSFGDLPCGTVMGKTGTAEVPKPKQDTALFVMVTPPHVDPANPQPQYVIVVVVEQGGFGGTVAAPIARRVYEALMGNPDLPPLRIFPPTVRQGD